MIDPGALFGAGTHPTTQLCLELLLDAEPARRAVRLGRRDRRARRRRRAAGLGAGDRGRGDARRAGGDPRQRRGERGGRSRRSGPTSPRRPRRGRRRSSPTCRSSCCWTWRWSGRRSGSSPPGSSSSAPARSADGVRHGRGRAPRARRVGRGRAGAPVIRLAVRVARADAEAVLAELLELAPGGLEEREVGEDAVEYVLYGAPGELPDLRRGARGGRRRARGRLAPPRSPTTGRSAGRPSTSPSTCRGGSGGCACARPGSRRWTATASTS